MKRLFLISLGLVFIILLTGMVSAKTTIRYMTTHNLEESGGYGEKVLQPAVEKFNQEHPDIEVILEPIPSGSYQDKVNMEIAAGKLPDIWDSELGWTPDYYERGILASVPEEMEIRFRKELMLPAVQTLEFEGRLWGAPPYSDCLALFYNVDMLQEAGVEVPATWEEFKEAAIQLTKKDDKGRLVQSGFTQWAGYDHVFWSYYFQNNGTLEGKNLIEIISSPEAVEAADFAFKQPYQDWKVASLNFYGGWMGFAEGKVAMTVNGNWYIPFLEAASEVNFAVAPLPVHKQAGTTLGGWNVLVSKDAPGEAWKFIDYLVSNPEVNYNKLKTNYLPTQKAVYESVNWENLNENLKIFYKLLPSAQPKPMVRGYKEFKRFLNSGIEKLVTGSGTTEDVFKEVAKQGERILK